MQNKIRQKLGLNISTTKFYFYINSMFMGAVKSLNKVGSSIIIYDQKDSCALINYNIASELNGFSAFYRNSCLISVQYSRNKIVDLVYRIDGYLLYLKYNESSKIHGDCYLANFTDRTILHLQYNEGIIKNRLKMTVVDKVPVANVFNELAFHLLVGRQHNRVLIHEVSDDDMNNVMMRKTGNKVQVCYRQNYSDVLVSGLGFEFIYRDPERGGYDPETNKFKDEFELQIVEKGYYKNKTLHGFGSKVFKNTNVYEGFFHNNVFNGWGSLKNKQKGNWIYGNFDKGEMVDIIDFSNEGDEGVRCENLMTNLRRVNENFVNESMEENNFDFLYEELERIISKNEGNETKTESFLERKKKLMKRITNEFTECPEELEKEAQILINKSSNKGSPANLKTELLMKKNSSLFEGEVTPKKKVIMNVSQKTSPNNFFLLPFIVDMIEGAEEKNKTELERVESISKKNDFLNMNPEERKKLSRIFLKSYSHLETSNKNDRSNSNKRRSPIFDKRYANKEKVSEFSFTGLRGKGDEAKESTSPRQTNRKKSPAVRTKGIFENKLPKMSNSFQNTKRSGDDEELGEIGFKRLESIRKSSAERKNASKSLRKNKNIIFEEQKEKELETGRKFYYVNDNPSVEEEESIEMLKKYKNLQNQTIKLMQVKNE